MCSLLLGCHSSKLIPVQRARKYMNIDTYPNHFYIHTFIPLIIPTSIYLPIHLSMSDHSSHGYFQVQSNKAGFIVGLYYSLSKSKSCLQFFQVYLLNWSIPLDVICHCVCNPSVAASSLSAATALITYPKSCSGVDSSFLCLGSAISHHSSAGSFFILLGLDTPHHVPFPHHSRFLTVHYTDTLLCLLEFCHPTPGKCFLEMLLLSWWCSNPPPRATPFHGLGLYLL